MNKVFFLIKQLIYDFIIAESFYIVNFWNSLWIKISNGPKSQISTGSRLPSKRSQKTRHLFITLSITIIILTLFLLLSSVNKLFCDEFCVVLQEGQMYGLHFEENLTFSAVGFALKNRIYLKIPESSSSNIASWTWWLSTSKDKIHTFC